MSVGIACRALTHIRVLPGGVLGAQCQYTAECLVVSEYRHRTEAEVGRIHCSQVRQVQRPIGIDPLDQHGKFIHVCQYPHRGLGAVYAVGV